MSAKNHKLKAVERGDIVVISGTTFYIDKIKVSHSSIINKILLQIKLKVTDLSAGICSTDNFSIDVHINAFIMLITENMQFKQSILALLEDLAKNDNALSLHDLSLEDILILINAVVNVNRDELTKKMQEMPSLLVALITGKKVK
jgi:hypothetical protein